MKKRTIEIPPGTNFNDLPDNQPQQIIYTAKPPVWLCIMIDIKGFICVTWIRRADISAYYVNIDDESQKTTVIVLNSGKTFIADHPVEYFESILAHEQ